jgi:predicted lipid-binding transport protein (Tim44 family)
MTIRIPAIVGRFDVQLVPDERGVLHLLQQQPRVDYLLAAVLKIGWRIVDSTPDERALLKAHGFGSGRVQWMAARNHDMNRFVLALIGMAGGLAAGVIVSILRLPLTFQVGDLAVTPPIGLSAIGGIVGFVAGAFRSRQDRSWEKECMFAAIYARKSTDQNGVSDEQRSVTRQIEHGKAYAARKG